MILFINLNESLIADNDEELTKFAMLAKFLLLDFSPCLKKGILMVMNECLKIRNKNIEKVLTNLEKEGFLNILICLYSSSCIDLRRIIIDLVKNLTNLEAIKDLNSNGNQANFSKKLLPFIKENLLNFQINNNNLNRNSNFTQIVKELIAEKVLQKIENEFTNQINSLVNNKEEKKNFNSNSQEVHTKKKDISIKEIKDNFPLENQIESIFY